jgi:integrase
MPKTHKNLLTKADIDTARPAEKDYKLSDGGGLFLLVTATGSRLWRVRYFLKDKNGGKRREQTAAIGSYSDITLKQAREKRDVLLLEVNSGNYIKKSGTGELAKIGNNEQVNNTFYEVSKKYLVIKKSKVEDKTYMRIERLLRKYAYPELADKKISEIKKHEIVKLLETIQDEELFENLKKTRAAIAGVFRYACGAGLCENNPAVDFQDTFIVQKTKNRPAQLNEDRLSDILKLIFNFKARTISVSYAMKILTYTCMRPGELIKLEWKNVNFETKQIEYIQGKGQIPHIIPFSTQVFNLFANLKKHKFESNYVFCAATKIDKHISDAIINKNYRKLGIKTKTEHTGHGWRAVFRTKMIEKFKEDREIVELQLGHTVRDVNGTAYNRAQFLDDRRVLMQKWSDYIDYLMTK